MATLFPSEGWASLRGFTIGACSVFLPCFAEQLPRGVLYTAALSTVPLVAWSLYSVFQGRLRHYTHLPAMLLGGVFAAGGSVIVAYPKHRYFGAYMCALAFFHWSEYMTTALYNRAKLDYESFLLDNGRPYRIAAVASWVEYAVRAHFFPEWSYFPRMAQIGLGMVLAGEFVRKLAMFTCRENFSHLIVSQRQKEHKLVTHGIYRISRHPSYMGWFWWSLGTQIVLCNPICFVGYTVASWNFFQDRILYEEALLIRFFGAQYVEFQAKVPIGIPFLRGHSTAPSSE